MRTRFAKKLAERACRNVPKSPSGLIGASTVHRNRAKTHTEGFAVCRAWNNAEQIPGEDPLCGFWGQTLFFVLGRICDSIPGTFPRSF